MAYLTKQGPQILVDALRKLSVTTTISNTSPGSVARALTEIITTELGDFYNILDFNTTQASVATAQGRSLDLIGVLYNTIRKSISNLAAVDASLGSFYFYIDTPYSANLIIPSGTHIFTDNTTFVGLQFSYSTVGDVVIPVGHTKAFASIRPDFSTANFTAGVGTLTVFNPSFIQPLGTTIRCTNPKAIQAQILQEDDDSYRARIIASVRTATGGTLDAVRMAALNVSGVRDISIRNTPYGLGTFEVLVVSEDNSISTQVVLAVQTIIDATSPLGVRSFLRQPTLLPVDISCSIMIQPTALNVDKDNTISRTRVAILRYLNTPLVGTPLIFNELIQAAMNATDITTDIVFNNFAINGTPVLRRNYFPAADEQLIPGQITVVLSP